MKDQGTGYHKEKRWSAFAESRSTHGKDVAQSHVWNVMIKDIRFAVIVHDKKNCQNTNQIEAEIKNSERDIAIKKGWCYTVVS